jgi:hypothetical protein
VHINHRRKSKRHHKAYFAWTSAKVFRQREETTARAKMRELLFKEMYDNVTWAVYKRHLWSVKWEVAWY